MQRKITIIMVHTPPEDKEINNKDQFFTKCNKVTDVGNTRELFLFGYFTDRIGRKINNKIVGPYGEE
jgi:hypothetical protein